MKRMTSSIDITNSRFVFPYTLEGSGQKERQDWWEFFHRNWKTGKLKTLPHERKKYTWKTQFSGLSRLMASFCDPDLSIVSVKIRHRALVYKDNWSHDQLVHNVESRSLSRLAIANYKADPETPTCTTDVDPTWTKVFRPEQNHWILPHNLWSSHD